MLWWLRRFTRPDTRTDEQRRADFLALPFNRPGQEAEMPSEDAPEHSLEAICDGAQIDEDKAGWEALLASLDEALSAADAGDVDASAMLAATEDLLRAYGPCLRVELRYGEPDDESAETRVIPLDR